MQHCTLHAFEQFRALYMHNDDDKYPSRPGFEPGSPRLQAPVDMNEPSEPATGRDCDYSVTSVFTLLNGHPIWTNVLNRVHLDVLKGSDQISG